MISFGPTEEQELVRDAMREFATDALRPIARELDEASDVSQDFLDTVAQLGLVSTAIPESYGGAGEARSPITNALILEELAYGDANLAVAALGPGAFANAVLDFGTATVENEALDPNVSASDLAFNVDVGVGPVVHVGNGATVAGYAALGFNLIARDPNDDVDDDDTTATRIIAPMVAGTSVAYESEVAEADEAEDADVAAAPDAEDDTSDQRKKPRRRRRKRGGKSGDDGDDTTEASADRVSDGDELVEGSNENEKPKRKSRSRSRKKPADAEAEQPSETSEPVTAVEPEAEPVEEAKEPTEEKPKRKPRARKKAAAEEPVTETNEPEMATAAPEPEAPAPKADKPKRKGWWSRATGR